MRLSASGAVIIAGALVATAGIIATRAWMSGTVFFVEDTASADKLTLPGWIDADLDALRHRAPPSRH